MVSKYYDASNDNEVFLEAGSNDPRVYLLSLESMRIIESINKHTTSIIYHRISFFKAVKYVKLPLYTIKQIKLLDMQKLLVS